MSQCLGRFGFSSPNGKHACVLKAMYVIGVDLESFS